MPVLPTHIAAPPPAGAAHRPSSSAALGSGSTQRRRHHHKADTVAAAAAAAAAATKRVADDANRRGIRDDDDDVDDGSGHAEMDSNANPQASWRRLVRGALRGKIMLMANVWTSTLVITILLAVVFRALQPTEQPSIGVEHYSWLADPQDAKRVSLDELYLDVRCLGRFTMEFSEATLDIFPLEADGLVTADHRDESALAPLLLAQVALPSWNMFLSHSVMSVSASAPSAFFAVSGGGGEGLDQQQDGEVILTGNFDGYVTVFASLPTRIFLKCYLKTSLASPHMARCESAYQPHINSTTTTTAA